MTEKIELDLGRDSKGLVTPGSLILIFFYNYEIISTDRLTIPHPMVQDRLFVLDPLNEIAPDYEHPILNDTISSLRNDLDGY